MEEQQAIFEKTKQDESRSIHAILFLLETELQRLMGEVERGSALLNVGTKTDFIKEIEAAMKNPGTHLLQGADSIDAAIGSYLSRKLEEYFNTKRENLLGVWYPLNEYQGELHYILALKNDSMATRIEYLDFLDRYESSKFSRRLPIHFHFVDKADIKEMKAGKSIFGN